MPESDILLIPRRRWLGRMLEKCQAVADIGGWFSKMQRVRRKNFLADLKSPQHRPIVSEVCRHESGREFQAALEQWLSRPGITVDLPPLRREPDRSSEPDLRCSVIINTLDRADDLALTLAALQPEWLAQRDELIIVLGPSGDGSEKVIRQCGLPCRVIHCAEKNLAISRNLGWRAARGRYLAFLDDDASPDDGWLDALLRPLEQDQKVGISAGFVLNRQGDQFLNRYVLADTLGRAFWYEEAASAHAKIASIGGDRAFITATGCNMAVRRSLLDEIGGFDPFYRYFLEETDVVWRALIVGAGCVVAPESRVRHRLAANLARKPDFDPATRATVIRSQIHYIAKFGKATIPHEEIASCLWERVLRDLEKIAWDCGSGDTSKDSCAKLQSRYLQAVSDELLNCDST